MRTRHHRRKILYAPGIISLIFVPLLFFIYTQRFFASRPRYGITIVHNMPRSVINLAGIILASKQFEHIYFNGDNGVDKIKLAYGKVRVMESMKSTDTSHGIWFHFSTGTSYGTFFKVIDMLLSDKEARFLLEGDDIRYYHYIPQATLAPTPLFCGTRDFIKRPAVIENPQAAIDDLWKCGNGLVCGFCILLFSYSYGLIRKRY